MSSSEGKVRPARSPLPVTRTAPALLSRRAAAIKELEVIRELSLAPSRATTVDFRSLVARSSARIALFELEAPLSGTGLDISQRVEQFWKSCCRCVEANLTFTEPFGITDPSAALGKSFSEFFPRSMQHDQMIKAWYASECLLRHFELHGTDAEGRPMQFSAAMYAVGCGGPVSRFWFVARDVTPLADALHEVSAQESHYRALVEHSGFILLRAEPSGAYRYVSPAFEEALGYPTNDLLKQPTLLAQLVHPADRAAYEVLEAARRQRHTKACDGEYRLLCRDGAYHWFYERQTPKLNESGVVEWYDSILFDIQERKLLEAELMHAQRMEVIGTLAGGLAHDFNNYLTAIIGQIGLCLCDTKENDLLYERLLTAEQAALRCSDITRQLLTFGRHDETDRVTIDVPDLVASTVSLLTHLLPSSIELQTFIANDVKPILGNSSQLQQVLMNLAINARDAMPNGGQLRCEVSSRTVDLDHPFNQLSAGRYVSFRLTDTGCGIPPHCLPHIFEPFFTTKAVGKGTGLGLSSVYSIVQRHGGSIAVSSEEGMGTNVTFLLPAASEVELETYVEAAPRFEMKQPANGMNRLVLIADDDEMVRGVMRAALTLHGFRVIEVTNGIEACQRIEQYKDELSLIVIDHTMPRKSGREVLAFLRQLECSIPVIFSSGYPERDIFTEVEKESKIRFIAKPFSIADFLTAAEEMASYTKPSA